MARLACPSCNWVREVGDCESIADGSDAQIEYRTHYRYEHLDIPNVIVRER